MREIPLGVNPQRSLSYRETSGLFDSSAAGDSAFREGYGRSAVRRRYEFAKRAFDVVFSLCGLLLLAPLLCAFAAGIKLTSAGPIFYRQLRFGREGRPFNILKFRTMYARVCDATATLQTAQDDIRITPLGNFLRRYNLDEYPQLFNILKGDMSVVGPRPHAVGMEVQGIAYANLIPSYHLRHSVRPGLTGLAQVNGWTGPVTDTHHAAHRYGWDLSYIDAMSFSVDMTLLAHTVRSHFLTLLLATTSVGGRFPPPACAPAVLKVESSVE